MACMVRDALRAPHHEGRSSRLPFSPCGRRWREAPDEGFSPRRQSSHAETYPSSVSLTLSRQRSTFSHKGRREGERSSLSSSLRAKRSNPWFVGWAKRSVPTIDQQCVGQWWARRKRAFAHPTLPPPPLRMHAPAPPASEIFRNASANSPAGSSASRPYAAARIRG